jgi:thiol-disulfide isomerase/thioredoxin
LDDSPDNVPQFFSRLFLAALLMAPSAAWGQMAPTPPETQPKSILDAPIDALAPVPLPPPGETMPSMVMSSVPGAPPMLVMPPTPKGAPATGAASLPQAGGAGSPPSADSAEGAVPGSIPALPGDLFQPAPAAPVAPPAPPSPETAETSPAKPVLIQMPEFLGIDQWLNSPAITKESLKGKVVLVDFWTYSCVNCLRTLPYLKEWHKKYKDKGLVLIGVHSPEFDFEKDVNNVKAAVQKFGIAYPVALDNRMATWAAYQNNVWPAHYFIDAAGRIRHIHLGEGDYDKSEQMIQKLLTEAAEASKTPETQAVETQPSETKPAKPAKPAAPAKTTPETMPALSKIAPGVDFTQIKSPETYLGLIRRERLVTSGRPIELNEWMFDGKWRTEGERIVLTEGTGKILFRFNAVKVNLVITPTIGGVQAVVKLDGRPVPAEKAGADVKNGTVMVTEPRLYELINLGGKGEEHIIEIEFLTPGAAAYAFTFG